MFLATDLSFGARAEDNMQIIWIGREYIRIRSYGTTIT